MTCKDNNHLIPSFQEKGAKLSARDLYRHSIQSERPRFLQNDGNENHSVLGNMLTFLRARADKTDVSKAVIGSFFIVMCQRH